MTDVSSVRIGRRIEIEARVDDLYRRRLQSLQAVDDSVANLTATLKRDGLVLDDLPRVGGVLTPMVAMGETLAERLRQRGFTLFTEVVPG